MIHDIFLCGCPIQENSGPDNLDQSVCTRKSFSQNKANQPMISQPAGRPSSRHQTGHTATRLQSCCTTLQVQHKTTQSYHLSGSVRQVAERPQTVLDKTLTLVAKMHGQCHHSSCQSKHTEHRHDVDHHASCQSNTPNMDIT